MYYIERIAIDDTHFLAGSVAEPSGGEVEWAVGTHAVGAEVIRKAPLHRVFRCAVARTGSDTLPPEQDTTAWQDMRLTRRYVPYGPLKRADGKLVYESHALEQTTGDIEFRLKLRYANAVALFGLRGAAWAVDVYDAPGGALVKEYSGTIKAPATGYWDYAYGQRQVRDRVLITGLPIYPNAEVRIRITANAGQLRRISQIEVGKLRFLPGVEWGGVEQGMRVTPRAYSYRKEEPDGTSTTLLYGTTEDMAGTVVLSGAQEDNALVQLRNLLGKGTAFTPTLFPGFVQSLVFATLESADVSRAPVTVSRVAFQLRGLPAH